MTRIAHVVLVSAAGEVVGMLPPLELSCPFWQESADVVLEARARFKVQVVVLRLLGADPSRRAGGVVSYVAELCSEASDVELLPVSEALRETAQRRDPKRMPWAEPGGPSRSLAWATAALGLGERGELRAVQQRSWNLSSLWRLETTAHASAIWLKQVPHFMKHESKVLGWLSGAVPGAGPTVLAADDSGRILLAHVPGEDLYGAPVAMRQLILERLHEVQCAGAAAVDELIELGAPDLRGSKRAADIARKLVAWSPNYPGLAELLQGLDHHLARLEECGLPATLVHADNHPGNARWSGADVKLLDWGESFVGHPVTDIIGLIQDLPPAEAAPLLESWCSGWKAFAPGSRPEPALESARFIAAMHGAATYAHFLQEIEQSEWPYHREDVARCLDSAAELLSRMAAS